MLDRRVLSDLVVWLPKERVLYAGDTVEFGATPYCGDAHFNDWGGTLANIASFEPDALVPGRGDALVGMGMPVTAALDAASTAARRWLGAGVFDDGDRADVLILDADPRQDLSTLRRPREIICGGVPIRG